MKKVLFGLLALSSLGFAKEAVPAPAKLSEPVAPAYVSAPAFVPVTASYLTLRFGGDIAPRYDRAELGYNPNFISNGLGVGEFLDSHSSIFGKSLNDKDAKGFGFEVAAEYMYPVRQLPGFELGLGVAFQRHGKLESVKTGFRGDLEDILLVHGIDPDLVDLLPNDLTDIVLALNTEREIPSFDSLPLYAVGKYKFDNWDMWGTGAKFYLKGDLGWSYNMKRGETRSKTSVEISNLPLEIPNLEANFTMDGHSEIENGLYWGAGFGVEYDNWTVDLMYKVNTAKVKGEYRLPVGGSVNGDSFDNKVSSFSKSLDYSRVALSLGYKF